MEKNPISGDFIFNECEIEVGPEVIGINVGVFGKTVARTIVARQVQTKGRAQKLLRGVRI